MGKTESKSRPFDNLRHVAETMDSQPLYKRLAHAASDEQLVNNADKAIGRGLLLENVCLLVHPPLRLLMKK